MAKAAVRGMVRGKGGGWAGSGGRVSADHGYHAGKALPPKIVSAKARISAKGPKVS